LLGGRGHYSGASFLSEFGDRPMPEMFFEANDFPGLAIADPFMCGGMPLIEANRVGCDVQGFDINPMAARIVREEIVHLDLDACDARERFHAAERRSTSLRARD
jgi:hypothetical protein